MNNKISIRVSEKQKEFLQSSAKDFGFNSCSDFARHLIEKGLETIKVRPAEYHMLSHTSQSTMLLRELLKNIVGNDVHYQAIVDDIREKSIDWTNKFQETLKK